MNKLKLGKILFLDIETVPSHAQFSEQNESMQQLWEEKFRAIALRMPEKYDESVTASQAFSQSAGIYSEFGKIICISVGYIHFVNETMHFRTKSFAGDDEKLILTNFSELLNKFCTSNEHTLCGHNIKEFDIPYICRRMLINGLKLPAELNISGKKPWEINHIDTMELWKFGDYKNYTSLKLLTSVFDVPTPKDDIDGSQVAAVYYNEKNIERIATYCQKDVVATARVYLRMQSLDFFEDKNIEYI